MFRADVEKGEVTEDVCLEQRFGALPLINSGAGVRSLHTAEARWTIYMCGHFDRFGADSRQQKLLCPENMESPHGLD